MATLVNCTCESFITLKTNLTSYTVVCMKKREKAGFLSPTTSKFALTKEKKERGGRKEEKKKSNGCTLVGRKRTIWQQRFQKSG